MIKSLDNTHRIYVVYTKATGFISGVHNVPLHTIENLIYTEPDLSFIAVDHYPDIANLYVLDGAITPRPTMPLVISGSRVSGIPVGATVWVGNDHYTCDDGEVIFDFDIPPTFPIVIDLMPYKTERVTLDY